MKEHSFPQSKPLNRPVKTTLPTGETPLRRSLGDHVQYVKTSDNNIHHYEPVRLPQSYILQCLYPLIKSAQPGQTLLDIGAGTAEIADEAESRGLFSVSLDLSPAGLAAARERSMVAVAQANAIELPIAPHSMDFVHLKDILPHFSKNERLQIFSEVARVLKPGGKILVAAAYTRFYPPYYFSSSVTSTQHELRVTSFKIEQTFDWHPTQPEAGHDWYQDFHGFLGRNITSRYVVIAKKPSLR